MHANASLDESETIEVGNADLMHRIRVYLVVPSKIEMQQIGAMLSQSKQSVIINSLAPCNISETSKECVSNMKASSVQDKSAQGLELHVDSHAGSVMSID